MPDAKRILGPFPPMILGLGVSCPACKQKFPHSTPAGKYPRTVVDLRQPHPPLENYGSLSCAVCWRPIQGKEELIVAPGFKVKESVQSPDKTEVEIEDEW